MTRIVVLEVGLSTPSLGITRTSNLPRTISLTEAFNSLSRDHNVDDTAADHVGDNIFQLPLSGSLDGL